ncbi:tyrosine-type recombinase/integrase [Novosphingobium sp. PhB55]|uniref:tyrosine-type recombinase/integrase n=1 Tax=Novosphingobium sp. PhB55 TaxID=2485106 RepID=UPI00141708C8|nr:tyrosine-type recombinase/integrase [Novosphingobium sp. PhB55]
MGAITAHGRGEQVVAMEEGGLNSGARPPEKHDLHQAGKGDRAAIRAAGMSAAGSGEDDAIVTVHAAGRQSLPQRRAGGAIDRNAQLLALVGSLLASDHALDAAAFRAAIAHRAAASVKALASDLDDYATFCRERRLTGLPAGEVRLVRYIEDCEARGLKPATAARRLASLGAVHEMLGCANPALADRVRGTLLAMKGRAKAGQRQLAALRSGDGGEGAGQGRAITLAVLLAACEADPPGLRDAALLSLGSDCGLRVCQLVALTLSDLALEAEELRIPPRKGGETVRVVPLSADTLRRLRAWIAAADLRDGPLFRRVAVRRVKARSGADAVPLRKLAWNHRQGEGRLGARTARPARVDYAIGEQALTAAAVRAIVKGRARRAAERGLVALDGAALEAAIAGLSGGSMRLGFREDRSAEEEPTR